MKRKVLFIIHKMTEGGAQKAASSVLNGMDADRYDKYIYIFDNTDCQYELDAEVIDGGSPRSKGVVAKIGHSLKRFKDIRLLKKSMDVSVSFLGTPNLLNLLTGTKGVKVVLSERNYLSGMTNSFTWLYRLAARWLYKRASKVVCVSELVASDLVEHYKVPESKVTTINNFVEVEKSATMAQEAIEGLEGLKPYVLCAGRLHSQKGFDLAIEALGKMGRTDLNLVIIGEGAERNRLEQLAQNLDLAQRVHLLGYMKNPYPYYAGAEAFLLTSYVEGFPNVVIEAMSCGTPVMAVDCISGPREILSTDMVEDDTPVKAKYGILLPRIERDESRSDKMTKVQVISEALDASSWIGYTELSLERASYYSKDRIVKRWDSVIG